MNKISRSMLVIGALAAYHCSPGAVGDARPTFVTRAPTAIASQGAAVDQGNQVIQIDPAPSATPTVTATSTPGPTPTQSITPAPTPSPSITPTPTPVPAGRPYTLVGRYDATNPNNPVFELADSKVGVSFTGTSLSVNLGDTGTDTFAVFIDGATTPTILQTLPNQTASYALKGLAAGNHTVWMIKRTEFMQYGVSTGVGKTTLNGFTLDAGAAFLAPPAARSRHIDFIGDSGWTGFGAGTLVVPNGPDCAYDPLNQDAVNSVPQLTGDILSADIVNASSSGQGVFKSVYDTEPTHLLPLLYEEQMPPTSAPAWDFSRQSADVVALSAGGDDLAGDNGTGYFVDANGNKDGGAAFIAAYTAWLARIRQHYPSATIVCVLSQSASGGDVATLGGAIQQAIANRAALGDTKVFYYNYFQNDPTYHTYDDIANGLGYGWGCLYHPSPAGAKWLAQRLAAFIASKMGW